MLTCSWRIRCNKRSSGPSNSPITILRSSLPRSGTSSGFAPATFIIAVPCSTVSGAVSGVLSILSSLSHAASGCAKDSHSGYYVFERGAGDLFCFIATLLEYTIQLLIADSLHSFLKRSQEFNCHVSQFLFQLSIALANEVRLDFIRRLSRH